MSSFLHTMVRVRNLEQSLAFYALLGMRELRRRDVPEGKYTLFLLALQITLRGRRKLN